MKSNFRYVCEMNERFGNFKGNPENINWERIEAQAKNILKELQAELMPAIRAKDIEAVRDAFCDINVFSYGGHHLMGLDADEDMRAVIPALYSRFCADELELLQTKAHYDALGVEYYEEGRFPFKYLKSAKDQGETETGIEYPKGKFLKSVNYTQPVFSSPKQYESA